VVRAAALYVAVMFGLGFLLGVPRTLLLEPRLGPAGAVLVEAVPMTLAMAFAAPWAARRHAVPPAAGPRLAMGAIALLLLVLAETALDLAFRGQVMWAARLGTADGLIGYALLLAFALMPSLRRSAG
jgi:hypothetical protein